MTKRLTLAERRKTCAVPITEDFVWFSTPLGDIPPFAKVSTTIPNVWARLRPDVVEWINANVRRRSGIKIEPRWVQPDPYAPGQLMEGRWLIFETQRDAILFKTFWL